MTRGMLSSMQLEVAGQLSNQLESGQTAIGDIGGTLINLSLGNGVSFGQADRGWELRNYVLPGGQEITINLHDFNGWDVGAGEGRDAIGQPMDILEVVLLIVIVTRGEGTLEMNPPPGTADVAWIPPQTAANHGQLRAGGIRCFLEIGEDGFPIEPGVHDELRLRAVGGTVQLDVIVLGRHDVDESSLSSTSSRRSTASTTSV